MDEKGLTIPFPMQGHYLWTSRAEKQTLQCSQPGSEKVKHGNQSKPMN